MNEELAKIASNIDHADDCGNINAIEELLKKCNGLLESEAFIDRAIVYFFIANCFNALDRIDSGKENSWDWSQKHKISELLNLRKSIAEIGFEALHNVLRCKVFTNMANVLSHLGRTIESAKYYNIVKTISPNFAMALGNKGVGLFHYSQILYDYSHAGIMCHFAGLDLSHAIGSDAQWDAGFRKEVFDYFTSYQDKAMSVVKHVGYDVNCDLNQWSLGESQKEISYRKWCLERLLFLNPLNDVCKLSVAATDIIHLPSHVCKTNETPRFPNYFNVLKQEYVAARYMHFEACNSENDHFIDKDVLLINGFDGISWGYKVEQLKTAYRLAYSIFDKIALFLNDYMNVELKVSGVNFRNIWGKFEKKKFSLYPCFSNSENWPLRGLYYLSKDLFDPNFSEVADPEARELSEIRNRAEHRYLGIQEYDALVNNSEYLRHISFDDFEKKSLKILSMVRESLIYLSLAMHQEEKKREHNRDERELYLPVQSIPVNQGNAP